MPSTPPPRKSSAQSPVQSEEESESSGFRFLLIAVTIAVVCGLSIRFYFSPDRLREWCELALTQQASKMKIEFQSAELKLSEGALPQVAIELQGLKLSKVLADCPQVEFPTAIEAARLRVPLRISDLLFGRVSIGTLGADDLKIDLDRFKQTCAETPKASPNIPPNIPPNSPQSGSVTTQNRSAVQPWWTDEQFAQIANVIHGFSFRKTRVAFENGTKWIELQSVSADIKRSTKQIHVTASLRVPQALTQGEQIPDLFLDAVVDKQSAEAHLAARLSEGTFRGQAQLKPAADRQLDIDAKMNLANVPLSTLVPLLAKTTLVKREMHPKFLWLNCEAAIQGKFQGLFQSNPLKLSKCDVQGNGTNVRLENAVRLPSGKWEPFTAQIVSLDVRQILDAFSLNGLDGIVNDYGRMQGEVQFSDRGSAKISALFHGAQFRFSNRSIRVLQDVATIETQLEVSEEGRVVGDISKVEFEGGEFAGRLHFDILKHAERGSLELGVKNLKLADDVQRVMLGGAVAKITGDVSANLIDGKLTAMKGGVHLIDLSTIDWDFADLLLQPGVDEKGNVLVGLKSPEMKLKASSPVFNAARSLVFNLPTFDEPEISIKDFVLPATVPRDGGLRWKNAKGTIANGRVRLTSDAGFTKEHQLSGTIQIDYPKVKKLAWEISGTTSEPEFDFTEKSASTSFAALAKDSKITESTLGLPPLIKGSQSRDESSISGDNASDSPPAARGAGERIREFSESVMEKARGMIPQSGKSANKPAK